MNWLMNALRLVLVHWFLTWVIGGTAYILATALYLKYFGLTDVERAAKLAREAKARTDRLIQGIRAEYVKAEKARVGKLIEERADLIVARVSGGHTLRGRRVA